MILEFIATYMIIITSLMIIGLYKDITSDTPDFK